MSISPVPERGTRALAAVAAAIALSACAVGPDFVRPAAPSVSQYTSGKDNGETVKADGVAQHLVPAQDVPRDWWSLFGSARLDSLVADATRDDPGAIAAEARLRQSQDSLSAGEGIFYPQLTGAAGASRQLASAAKVGSSSAGNVFNLFTLSATVSYALDIFGGNRRAVEALGADVDFARASTDATYLTLSANIANTAIASAAYRAEIQATQEMAGMEREQVALAQIQVRAGTAPYSSVLSLESQLAATEAGIPVLEQKVVQSEDLLAALCGRMPSEWARQPIAFSELHLPVSVPTSVPSALVRRRPDILAAEADLHAATADVGVTTAAMLPNITLSGTYGTAGLSTSKLFGANAAFWSAGAGLAQPLFDGGTLWYQRKGAIDARDVSAALYRQTVLAAFEQVADSLRAVGHDADVLEAQERARDTAADALHLVQVNYRAGLATYSDLLIADVQFHQADIAALEAKALRYQDTVALFVALGGGWGDTGETAPNKLAANGRF